MIAYVEHGKRTIFQEHQKSNKLSAKTTFCRVIRNSKMNMQTTSIFHAEFESVTFVTMETICLTENGKKLTEPTAEQTGKLCICRISGVTRGGSPLFIQPPVIKRFCRNDVIVEKSE
jgi:hypothetical protein